MTSTIQALIRFFAEGQAQTDLLKVIIAFCGAGVFFAALFGAQILLIRAIEQGWLFRRRKTRSDMARDASRREL